MVLTCRTLVLCYYRVEHLRTRVIDNSLLVDDPSAVCVNSDIARWKRRCNQFYKFITLDSDIFYVAYSEY